MIQINLYRTRTRAWKAEIVITEPGEPMQAPREFRYQTATMFAPDEDESSDALARRAVLELAHVKITAHIQNTARLGASQA